MARFHALFLGLIAAISLSAFVPAADAQVVIAVGHRHHYHHHYHHYHHHYYHH